MNNRKLLLNKGIVRIEKQPPQVWMMLWVLLYPFTIGLLTEILPLPAFIKFSLDAVLIALCLVFIFQRRFEFTNNLKPLVLLVVTFFIYTAVVYCFHFQSPFYFIWGARNCFRFYVAFFAFVACVNEDTANNWLKMLDVLFWVNIVVSIFQFLVLNIRQDYLGGLFGSRGGTNGYTLLFFCIVICKSLLSAFNGTETTLVCVLKSAASLLVAAMAEMKFYFVAFIFLMIMASALTKFSRKKLILVSVASIAILIGGALLSFWFSEFKDFMTWENLWNSFTKTHYSSSRDLNRLSAIFTLSKDFVVGLWDRLFGLGLGNCDVSELAIFNSVFYQNYSYLHYTWFSSAMLFLETGYVGLLLYSSFFVTCFRYARKKIKDRFGNLLFSQMAVSISLLCIIIMFYNSSLRIEAGYMAYFVLALPFLSGNQDNKQK